MFDENISHLVDAWPGKIIDGEYHPALWHMLDVAAVANRLLEYRPLSGDSKVDRAILFLVALHDLGKISNAFRDQITGQASRAQYHSQLSFVLLQEYDDLIGDIMGGEPEPRRALYAAVAGHHGGPPEEDDARRYRRRLRAVGPEACAVVPKFLHAVAALFPDASLDGIDNVCPLTWRVSGLTVQADWIGSNSDWFGLQPAGMNVSDYWHQAQAQAAIAVSNAGLHRSCLRQDARILADKAPRPMQEAVQDIDLPEGPALALIEDATGAGKTEASLILAQRMMAQGKGQGVFFALPTMATSNAMLERVAQVAPVLYEGRPSLGLSHGRAAHNDIFRQIRGNDGSDPQEPVTCGQWLADDRRRILFADIGVGTIDQALLSVIPTRFNTLRLWALSGKILIVDEAHDYDPFMEVELCRLLRFHAMLGGSAILMTATLPQQMRNEYAEQFQRGLGVECPEKIHGTAYPQLTVVSDKIDCYQPAPVPATRREIKVKRTETEQALEVIVDGVSEGAACVWICNAVDDAIATVQLLRARGVTADLLHARFIVADRLEKERGLQDRFGPKGKARAGQVLVATQVVEASLDIDFDLMVSDLAPIGSLIQRSGRLWRHERGKRPVDGPCLYIVAPDPDVVIDSRWLHRVLTSGGWVYPVSDQWRTARAVFDKGVVSAPEDLRGLIEAVHGSNTCPVPEALGGVEIENEAKVMVERGIARNQLMEPGCYLESAQGVYDEDRLATRLGIPQVTLWLARRSAGVLEAYASTWEESEVRMLRSQYEKLGGVNQETPEIQAVKAGWPEWRKGSIQIAPVSDDGEIVEGLRYDTDTGLSTRPTEV